MNMRRISIVSSLLLVATLFGSSAANSDQGLIQIIVNGPDADGITNVGICFTNPAELSGWVNYEISGVGSGGFLKHDGTPACPNYASGSSGFRLTAGATYNYVATASNGGRSYSTSISYIAVALDPALEAARIKRVADDEDFRNRQQLATAAATLESQAWNAANPGKQKCVQWGPIVHANGVSTASGGVCANPVEPGPGTTVQTVEAPTVEATTSTPPPTGSSSTPAQTTPVPTTPDSNPQLAAIGSGNPFTRVLPGQLSTSQCPVGFQAANGIIVAIGTGTFTECWPEKAWQAWRLGGSTWEQFKSSGGTYDVQAVIDLNAAIADLKVQAKLIAQTAADSTPGIQRCSKWSGYGQTGQECAYTFVAPVAGTTTSTSAGSSAETSGTSGTTTPVAPVTPTSDTSTVLSNTAPVSPAAPVTPVENVDPTSVKVTQSSSGSGQLGLTTVSVEGSTQEISKLVQKIVITKSELKSLDTILTKLDALRALTYSKIQNLPIERNIEETAVSLTPDICSVKGTKVTSLKPGKCVFTYELIGASGNSFTVQKEIVFKK